MRFRSPPLLEARDRQKPTRHEATADDWDKMERHMRRYVQMGDGASVVLILACMTKLKPSIAPKPDPACWEMVEGGLRELRVEGKWSQVLKLYSCVKTVSPGRDLAFDPHQLEVLRDLPAGARDAGTFREDVNIGRYFNWLRDIGEDWGMSPTSRDWRKMHLALNHLRDVGRPRVMAEHWANMKRLDPARAPDPTDSDWRKMTNELKRMRRDLPFQEADELAAYLINMRELEERASSPDTTKIPALRRFRK